MSGYCFAAYSLEDCGDVGQKDSYSNICSQRFFVLEKLLELEEGCVDFIDRQSSD